MAHSSAQRAKTLLVIFAVVVLAYANSIHDTFHLDDEHSLVANPHIRQVDIAGLFSDPQMFSRNPGSEMYRPLVLISYAVTYQFFAYNARVYHLFNTGIHLLVAFGLYGL
jgi:hypothetical protein